MSQKNVSKKILVLMVLALFTAGAHAQSSPFQSLFGNLFGRIGQQQQQQRQQPASGMFSQLGGLDLKSLMSQVSSKFAQTGIDPAQLLSQIAPGINPADLTKIDINKVVQDLDFNAMGVAAQECFDQLVPSEAEVQAHMANCVAQVDLTGMTAAEAAQALEVIKTCASQTAVSSGALVEGAKTCAQQNLSNLNIQSYLKR